MAASKFHISLNVHDLNSASAFLELLLGTKPTQLHSNYAKFELADPALVLSLVPTEVPSGAGINHLGFRLPNREALDAMRERLGKAGIAHEIEESVACCYSRQSKFWVHDPAGNLWEFYVLEEPGEQDAKPSGNGQRAATPVALSESAVWGHRLGEPFPDRIPFEDAALDKVVFEGTLNAELSDDQAAYILNEAARALRGGGTLILHGLSAESPLPGKPSLPGPAAAVQHVPTHREVLDAVEAAGFVGLELTTFGESHSFTYEGVQLREMKLRAWRSDSTQPSNGHVAIYRGPFVEMRDESGRIFRRGEETPIDEQTYDRLRESGCAASFIFQPSPVLAS